ncbi:DNA polymerase III subunit gamma and tau [Micrococcus luteus]|uniref:DNA polymerase III subunit gamma and tau n=2 Tax=Micrococcus luteus TaxID=1270 RepID=UPI002006D8C2|nr:DNA polymerase III subunit gamma and tau [Micrococcus luteus]MCK6064498.1 DNA polymerase III subunit gamma and tau [Micrococcus luteus]MCK6192872.1 DNA polymerase III subunit gamma and tau [Micrococcus luteus]MCK6195048.1 DNA polymerase III subunit gamma and tau [Micrococcus luteus]
MSTALYRRYRPDRFEDVIGQDHVTVPLRTALAKDRVNHAYLFSGPRGCGKTTSARILARCLNCAQGPTPTPCGECDSCRDLATGGPGSLDVLEIDAASHGGVEDARGLRERATFAPVRDRYKILIIDEAHMVTAAGFNALLKIVEEPPEHLKFIFATTEPEKVIGTIRSRTHHYPFRLVPPEPLIAYLEQLCAEEGVSVEKGVLPLVVRAGTGSVRDTLSVLDQLIAGAQEGQVSYELAVSLLGFTPEALLDDVIDAVAADDTPTVFRVVDRVVQSGQDPRRFVEDLLDRFRDLVIARALPEEAGAILHGMPEDQVRRLSAQAAQLSRAELSRLADITNLALTDMVGATSPRLHLELLMARLLLPASDETHRGLAARLEALERRLELGGTAPVEDGAPEGTTTPARSGTPAADGGGSAGNAEGSGPLTGAALARAAMRRPEESAPTASTAPPERWTPPAPQSVAEAPEGDVAAGATGSERPQQPPQPGRPEPAEVGARSEDARRPEAGNRPGPEGRPEPEGRPQAQDRTGAAPAPAHGPEETAAPSNPTPAPAASQVEMIRRAWPDILAALEDASRLVWMLVKDNASVAGYDGSLLTIGFQQDGPRQSLLGRGGDRVLGEAVHQVLGIRPRLDLILGGDAPTGDARAQSGARPAGPARTDRPERPTPQQSRPDRPAAAQPNRPAPAPGPAPREPESSHPAPPRSAAPSTAEDDPAPPAAPPRATPQRETPQPSSAWTPAAPATSWGPTPTSSTTPAPAPPADGWGGPDEEPPAWDDAPPPEEDPWDSLPAFDPDAEQDDSDGPEGWTPSARDAEERPVGAAGWDGPVPSVDDWGAPPQAAPAPDGAAPAAGQGPPVRPDAPTPGESEPSAEEVRRAYDPGPLVREEEHSIPVFARPEAELRAEFAKRFGATRPAGFDDGAGAAADGDSARPATPSPAPDDDALATERRDPHPAASDAGPSSDDQRRPTGAPTADATPDPGVPADDAAAAPRAAAGPTGADLPGSGHPASMYPRLMERLRAGGPLEPPVNAGSSGGSGTGGPGAPGGPGPDATPGTPVGGRPSAASLGARPADAEPAGGASAPPSLDARAAAIRAAREAAQGRGPARPADTGPAAPATSGVGWEDEVASDDDVPLEDSGLVGRAVVERVLGGRLLEERPNDA